MKKNISINLYGTLYQIDEDAYNLLERYLDSMKSYFSRQEGGEEIADDIEHRVAELLWEKKEAGQEAVNIEMIKEIIGKIGDPEQIDNNDTEEPSSETSSNTENTDDKPLDSHPFADGGSRKSSSEEKPEFAENENYDKGDNVFDRMKTNMKGRRLYRDVNNKVIGGVCSGMANYWGGDPTIWRLGTVIAAFALWTINIWWIPAIFSWIIPLGYCLLWLILPVVRTAEDNLRMRGEEVNPQNLNQEILNESERQSQNKQYHYQPIQHDNDGCLKIAGVGCLLVLIFPLLLVVLAMVFAAPILSGLGSGLLDAMFNPGEATMMHGLLSATSGMLWSMIFCIVMFLAIPIFFLIHWLRGSSKPLGTAAIVILIIVWLLSLGGGVYFFSTRVVEVMKNSSAIEMLDSMDSVDPDFDPETGLDDDYCDSEPDTVAVDTIPYSAVDPTADEQVNMSVSPSKVSIKTPDANLSVSPKGVKIQTVKKLKTIHKTK